MPRPLRIQAAGAIYHIAARGNAGRPVFLDDRHRELFLTLFGMTVARYGWRCYGFCLMTTHYHLLVMTHKKPFQNHLPLDRSLQTECGQSPPS